VCQTKSNRLDVIRRRYRREYVRRGGYVVPELQEYIDTSQAREEREVDDVRALSVFECRR
jgi:hypothetical protein